VSWGRQWRRRRARAAAAVAVLREGKEEAGKWKCERRGVTGGRWGVKCQAEARRGLDGQANGDARPSTRRGRSLKPVGTVATIRNRDQSLTERFGAVQFPNP